MNIFAVGGGGFTHQSDALLEDYLITISGKNKPLMGFLATASDEDETKIARFYERFYHCSKASHLSLNGPASNILEWVVSQDIIYVGGGNTKKLIERWREAGVPELLRTAATRGTVLAGVSAGAVCWFDTALTDSAGDGLRPLPCLAMINGSCCPHFDEPGSNHNDNRRRVFTDLITSGDLPAGVGIDDGAAVHYYNGLVYKVVSARAQATAYSVRHRGGTVEAIAMESVHLEPGGPVVV